MKFNKQEATIYQQDKAKELSKKIESAKDKLKVLSKELKEKFNLPLTNDLRIDINGFQDVFPSLTIQQDLKKIQSLENNFKGEVGQSKNPANSGYILEILKTLLFNKYLNNDFIVVRSSNYDDYINKIDNIILNKKTGEIVCAFDEVASMSGEAFERKKKQVLDLNKQGGVFLKYGFSLKENKIEKGSFENLTCFYLP
ncbi:MAG: hypothetical protein ACP5H7_02930, partial [Minisyncoccia bacterium]